MNRACAVGLLFLVVVGGARGADLIVNPAVLTTEHVDVFRVDYAGGWSFSVDDEDNAVVYAPNAVIHFVDPLAKTTQPAGAQWNFLGAGAGGDVWILPQSQNPNLLYAGTRTSAPFGTFTGGMNIRLRNLQGPGHFSIYNTSLGTPTVRMAGSDGITAADSIAAAVPGHAHYNWGFSAAGVYKVEISASGNFTGGGSSDSYNPANPTEYYFAVDTPVQVASLDNSRFLSIDSSGKAVTVADSASGLLTPMAVTFNHKGERFVADTIKNQIVKFNLAGQRTTFADLVDGVLFPTALAHKSSTDELFVGNYINDKILKVDASGNATVFADAADGVNGAFGMALDSAGNLFVSDLDTARILKFDSAGNGTVFADAADGILTPMGLAFDDAGYLFVSDTILNKIFRFDSLGNKTVFADLADGILFPTGISFDPNGQLFVANYINSKIIKFDSVGNGSVFADAADGLGGTWGLDFFDLNLPEPESFSLGAGAVPAAAIAAVPEASSLTLMLALALACAACAKSRRRARPATVRPPFIPPWPRGEIKQQTESHANPSLD